MRPAATSWLYLGVKNALVLLALSCACNDPKPKPPAQKKGFSGAEIRALEAAEEKAEAEHPEGLPDCGPGVKGPCSLKTTSEIGHLVDGAWQRGDQLPRAVHGHGEALRGAYVAPDGTAFLAGYNYTGAPGPDTGVVYRKDPGGAWTIVFKKPEHEVGHLFGTSGSDVWVTGVETVAHWDGTSWHDDPPADLHFGAGVWGDGKSVYVSGDRDGSPKGAVWRRDARGAWTVETTIDEHLHGIAGIGDELYVVGNGGVILHRSKGRWHKTSTGDEQHLAVFVAAPGDVYVAGTRLLHGTGDGPWTEVALPKDAQVITVWGRGPHDVYAGTLSGVFHFDGTAWTASGWTHDVEAIAGNAHEVLVANQHSGG